MSVDFFRPWLLTMLLSLQPPAASQAPPHINMIPPVNPAHFEVHQAVVTAYAPLDVDAVEGMCFSGNPNITATGTQVRLGVAAADPSRLPFGTRIYIFELQEEFVIEDTGSALRRDREHIRIDIVMVSRSQALQFGRRYMSFYVIEE